MELHKLLVLHNQYFIYKNIESSIRVDLVLHNQYVIYKNIESSIRVDLLRERQEK